MSRQGNPRGGRSTGPNRAAERPLHQSEDRSHLLPLLEERLRFETLLSRLSATFIHLPAEEVDSQLERGLQQIVGFLGIESSSLAQFSADGSELLVTHSYTIPGFTPLPRVDLAAVWPWYTARIRTGETLRFTRLPEEIPPEAVHEREYFLQNRQDGPRSHLVIPLKVGESILGGIGFGSYRRRCDWPDDLVQSLQLVGEIFANALARKRAEEARRESEARLRHLLESTNAIPWVADAQSWRFTYVGPQAGRLLGYPLDDWYRESFWAEHIHPDDREEALAFCLEHSQQHTNYEFEYRMVATDGRPIWIHDIVNVVAENGAPRVLRGFMINVTFRRLAEEEARGLREQFARVGRITMMGELAASIAHEVNQPLCAIVSNAQAAQRLLAADTADLNEVRETLQDIVADSRRASEVIARIRGLFQKHDPERKPLDLNEAIREVLALLESQLTRKMVAISLDLAANLPPVLGDRVQLQQVVLNLVLNASEAMSHVEPEQRELSVRSARDREGALTVSVRDSGPGIAAEQVEQVFDAFFTTKPGGIGIGLAISRSIIEAHGGRIWADAIAGRGAAFHLTLPAAKEPSP